MMKSLLILTASMLFCMSCAQSSRAGDSVVVDTDVLVQEVMDQAKKGFSSDARIKELDSREPAEVLAALRPYERDPDAKARHCAYTMAWQIGVTCPKLGIRTEVVERLATACGDSDVLVWQSASARILSFPPQYFSDKAKRLIHDLLARPDRQGSAILLAGQANMTADIPVVRNILVKGRRSEYRMWAGRLALARLGSKEDISYCVEQVRSEPDLVRKVGKMLHGLAYMRQPEAVAVIKDVLDSDKFLPSTVDNDDGPGWGVAQYAIDILANILDGFPVPARFVGGYSPESIGGARVWMNAQASYTFVTEPTIYRPDQF